MSNDTQNTKLAAIKAIRDIAIGPDGEPIRAAIATTLHVNGTSRQVAAAATRAVSELQAPAKARAKRKASKSKATAKPARRAVGGKRDPKAVEALTERLFAHVLAHPGQRMEQITKALGVKTAELALPVKRLIAEKRIKKAGERRTTSYTATGVSPKASKAKANGVAAKTPEAEAAAPAN